MRTPLFAFMLLFLVLALVSSLWGIRPLLTLKRFHRLLLFGASLAACTAFVPTEKDRLVCVLPLVVGLIAGTTLLGLIDIVRVPVEVLQGRDLYDAGNMRDPQMYMVALAFLMALWCRKDGDRKMMWWGVLVLCINAIGLIIHFKRGTWIATGVLALLIGVLMGRRKAVTMMVVIGVILLFLIPQTRTRIFKLQVVMSEQTGGRYVLWSKVSPPLIKQYPFGVGYGAVRHEDFSVYDGYIQPHLNHLHNNLLEITLELGWGGVVLWMLWMGCVGWMLYASYAHLRRKQDRHRWLACGAFAGFCGLLLNGIVEFNFGDTEIIMTYAIIQGMAGIIWLSVFSRERDS